MIEGFVFSLLVLAVGGIVSSAFFRPHLFRKVIDPIISKVALLSMAFSSGAGVGHILEDPKKVFEYSLITAMVLFVGGLSLYILSIYVEDAMQDKDG